MADKERYINWKFYEENKDIKPEIKKYLQKCFGLSFYEEDTEERNDIYIYKTLRYPPESTPPTAN